MYIKKVLLIAVFSLAVAFLNSKIASAVPAAPSPICEINAQVISLKEFSNYYRVYLDISDIKVLSGEGIVECNDSYIRNAEIDGAGLILDEYKKNLISVGQKIKASIHFGGDENSAFHFNLSNIQIIDSGVAKPSTAISELANRLKGRILLQVESRGEAWYVSPKNSQRYYLAGGEDAYQIMKTLGVGISNKDFAKIKTDSNFRKKFIGQILLQVESHGEAYYISSNNRYNYLKDGAAAYKVMRELGLGIKTSDLEKIAEFTVSPKIKPISEEDKIKYEAAIKSKIGSGWQFMYRDEDRLSLKGMHGNYLIKSGAGDLSSEEASSSASTAFELIKDLVALPLADFKERQVSFDGFLNRYEVVLQQYRNGVMVAGGQIYFSIYKNGTLYNITNNTYPYLTINTAPKLTPTEALNKLLLGNKVYASYNDTPVVTLVVLPPKQINETSLEKLAYRIVFDERTAFVDAFSGEILMDYSNYVE